MMNLKHVFITFLGALTFSSCIEHVVIPPPVPVVELDGSFLADTFGTQISYVNGVNGFYLSASNFRQILTPPMQSNAKYFSTIQSTNLVDMFKVSIGKVNWISTDGTFPPVPQWRIYFESLTNVPFSENAENGVELEWRDSNNEVWKTSETSPNPQSFNFIEVSQESDEDGDYLKYKAVFTATFYSPDGLESRTLNNGYIVGYFQNN
jgi:hypothetical protein